MTVRNPSPPNEPPLLDHVFTARVVDGSDTLFFEPPGLHEASFSPLDLERGRDKDDKEDTLPTRTMTTTTIANTTTSSSLRDVGTCSVLLPASFQRDPLSSFLARREFCDEGNGVVHGKVRFGGFDIFFGGHFKRNRVFFNEGNGVVHVKVRLGRKLPQKPEALAMLHDDLWNHLSANYRAFLGFRFGDFVVVFLFLHWFFDGILIFFPLFAGTMPLYVPIAVTVVDLFSAIWLRKWATSQTILKNHMVDDLKARFLAQGYILDCYLYCDRVERTNSDGDKLVDHLCFVIYPTSLGAQAFVRYKGDILLGEGFGTSHIDVTDFPKEKPKNLANLDDDLWNDYTAKMTRRSSVNINERETLFTFYVFTTIAWYTAIAWYGWFGKHSDSSDSDFAAFLLFFMTPVVVRLFVVFLLMIILLLFILDGVKLWDTGEESRDVVEDFTGRFQENGYTLVIVEEHGLIVFIPAVTIDQDGTNTEVA